MSYTYTAIYDLHSSLIHTLIIIVSLFHARNLRIKIIPIYKYYVNVESIYINQYVTCMINKIQIAKPQALYFQWDITPF